MDCVICKHGKTADGLVTVTLNRGNSVIVVKEVPAQVCSNCGEYYLSEEVSRKLLAKANAAVSSGVEVEILRYAA
jgi:YgiT-type zinc finger domain-containing protein